MSDATVTATTEFAISKDGTRIAFERAGSGPLLVLASSAAALGAASGLPPTLVDWPRWAQRRRRLEAAALVAVVPLFAAVLGVFGTVVDLARGAE